MLAQTLDGCIVFSRRIVSPLLVYWPLFVHHSQLSRRGHIRPNQLISGLVNTAATNTSKEIKPVTWLTLSSYFGLFLIQHYMVILWWFVCLSCNIQSSNAAFHFISWNLVNEIYSIYRSIPGMTGPPNSFTARGPVTLTAILFTQPAV